MLLEELVVVEVEVVVEVVVDVEVVVEVVLVVDEVTGSMEVVEEVDGYKVASTLAMASAISEDR